MSIPWCCPNKCCECQLHFIQLQMQDVHPFCFLRTSLNKIVLFLICILQARDLPRILQALYAVIPYFIFSPQEGCRSSLFSATDPQVPEFWETLKSDDWPVCPFISQDCRPTNPSEEAHNTETAHRVWEKTLELVGLPLDAVEKLIEGKISNADMDLSNNSRPKKTTKRSTCSPYRSKVLLLNFLIYCTPGTESPRHITCDLLRKRTRMGVRMNV